MSVICEYCGIILYDGEGLTSTDYGICKACYLERVAEGKSLSLILEASAVTEERRKKRRRRQDGDETRR